MKTSTAKIQITLASLAVGSRLLVRSRLDWRFAAISKVVDERVSLTVCSPKGRTYRLWRDVDTMISLKGAVPVLTYDGDEDWRDNFTTYDARW